MAKLSCTTRKTLFDLLHETGTVSLEDLQSAADQAEVELCFFTEVLISRGLISEEEIAARWVQLYGRPYLNPCLVEVDREVEELLTLQEMEEGCLVPIDRIGNSLVVVAGCGVTEEMAERLEVRTGMHLEVMVGRLSDIRRVIALFRSHHGESR